MSNAPQFRIKVEYTAEALSNHYMNHNGYLTQDVDELVPNASDELVGSWDYHTCCEIAGTFIGGEETMARVIIEQA